MALCMEAALGHDVHGQAWWGGAARTGGAACAQPCQHAEPSLPGTTGLVGTADVSAGSHPRPVLTSWHH